MIYLKFIKTDINLAEITNPNYEWYNVKITVFQGIHFSTYSNQIVHLKEHMLLRARPLTMALLSWQSFLRVLTVNKANSGLDEA